MTLQDLNARLDSLDYVVQMQSNGEYRLVRIERNALYFPGHAKAYDRLVRTKIVYPTLEAAQASVVLAERNRQNKR